MSTNTQNIAILGAGIMGLCAAYSLSRAGHTITLYDPAGFPADNASFVAGGMLAPYSEIEHMNGPWIEAGLFGIEFWRNFTQAANPATRDKIDFAQNGSLIIAHPQDSHLLERIQAHLDKAGHPAQQVRTSEIEPALNETAQSGLLLPQEAHLNPAEAMHALLTHLKETGITLIPQAASPETLSPDFDHVIDCRGLAVAQETEQTPALPSLRGVKGELLIVRNPDFTLSRPVRLMHPRYPLYIIPRANQIFMIGATQIESEGNHIALRSMMELSSALYSLHPSFGESEILHIKSGIRPAYPDNFPRINLKATKENNIISCNGLFRHGFLLAPVMADIITAHISKHPHEFFTLLTGHPPHDRLNKPEHQRQTHNTQRTT